MFGDSCRSSCSTSDIRRLPLAFSLSGGAAAPCGAMGAEGTGGAGGETLRLCTRHAHASQGGTNQ